jgi:hypothetical protein
MLVIASPHQTNGMDSIMQHDRSAALAIRAAMIEAGKFRQNRQDRPARGVAGIQPAK